MLLGVVEVSRSFTEILRLFYRSGLRSDNKMFGVYQHHTNSEGMILGVSCGVGIEPRASHRQGMCSTIWAIFLACFAFKFQFIYFPILFEAMRLLHSGFTY